MCNGDVLMTLAQGHSDGVSGFVAHRHTAQITSGGVDGTVRFWDSETGCCLRTYGVNSNQPGLRYLQEEVLEPHPQVAFTAVMDVRAPAGTQIRCLAEVSGTAVVCGGSDGTMRVYDMRGMARWR